MKLIADSGASSTEWIVIDANGEEQHFQTQGLNPYYLDTQGIENILAKELIPFIDNEKIESICFYGAGCSTVFNNMLMEDAFTGLFPNSTILINSDLLGAARALLGSGDGIACILGTGSNSCRFNGREIVENVPSLGYFFGDEGSGAHMGKLLCTDFMLGKVPEDIAKAFTDKYNQSRESILHAVYRLPFPNRFLATFSHFMHENVKHPYVAAKVSGSFRDFIENNVKKYAGYEAFPVYFTGSVAWYFRDILSNVAKENGIEIAGIERSPMKGLIGFHK